MAESGDGRAGANAEWLKAAGYVFDDGQDVWQHPATRRVLDGRVARSLTFEQLSEWIAAGAKRGEGP